MLSKFSDNLRMLHGKRKRQISENVYNRRKMQAGCQSTFSEVFSTFLKVFLYIYGYIVYNKSIEA